MDYGLSLILAGILRSHPEWAARQAVISPESQRPAIERPDIPLGREPEIFQVPEMQDEKYICISSITESGTQFMECVERDLE